MATLYAVTDKRAMIITKWPKSDFQSFGKTDINAVKRVEHSSSMGTVYFSEEKIRTRKSTKTVDLGFIGIRDSIYVNALLRHHFFGEGEKPVPSSAPATPGIMNNIEVTEDEITRAVAQQASQYPGQEKQFYDLYMQNPQLLAQIRAPLFEEKIVDFIVELAEVKEETVTRDELYADPDDEGAKPAKKKAAPKKKAAKKKTAAKKTTAKKKTAAKKSS